MQHAIVIPRSQSLNAIGQPITFVSGPFAGRTLRAQLEELQKADIGRKCGKKDRRPLDPPPVVRLRLFEVHSAGGQRSGETEWSNLAESDNLGFVCHVDLYRAAGDPYVSTSTLDEPSPPGHPHYPGRHPERCSLPVAPELTVTRLSEGAMSSPVVHYSTSPQATRPYHRMSSTTTPVAVASRSTHLQSSSAVQAIVSPRLPATEPVATFPPDFNGTAVSEDNICTGLLVGTTFVSSSCLDYEGRKALMCIFPDLAVKEEGTYFLRYRVFNIFNAALGTAPIPFLSKCTGGTFTIYSTKTFPGLRASTDLTKHVSYFGVRVNSREQERKRRKGPMASRRQAVLAPVPVPTPPPSGASPFAGSQRGAPALLHSLPSTRGYHSSGK